MAIEPYGLVDTNSQPQKPQAPQNLQAWKPPGYSFSMPAYNPTYSVYTPGGANKGVPGYGVQRDEGNQAPAWNMPGWGPTDQAGYRNSDMQQALSAWGGTAVPVMQGAQNAYQYGRDADTADFRYGLEYDRNMQNDIFNQQLAARGQLTQEQGMYMAADQFDRSLDHTKYVDTANIDLRGRENQTTYDLGMGNIGARRYDTDMNREIGLGNIEAQRYGTDVQRELGLGNIGARNRETDVNRELGLGNIGVQQQANEINRALGEGRLSLDQAANAWRQTLEFNRLEQEGQMAREANAAQERMVNMQTWGRRQAPNARWMRNW